MGRLGRHRVLAAGLLLLLLFMHVVADDELPDPRYRFLAALTLGGHSPSMDTLAVAAALAARGHHVAAVVPENDMDFSTRAASRHGGGRGAEQIEWLPYAMPFTVSSPAVKELASRVFKGNRLTLLSGLQQILSKPCALMMANATLLGALERGRYDAVLSFTMPGDLGDCACILAHHLGLPVVTVHGVPFMTAPLGTPQFGSGLTRADLLTLRGRAVNALFYCGTRAMHLVLHTLSTRGLAPIRKRLALPLGPPYTGASCRPLLKLCANSFLFEAPRPMEPHEVMIGPIAPRAARGPPEPPEVAAFVTAAPAGFAVVSFGSVPHVFSSLGRGEFEELAAAFADAPLRVVWLMQRGRLPGNLTVEELPIGANTLVAEWVDLNDLLAQPNCRLFITHGGCHSSYEALHHGVPVIGVPFQFEQLANAKALAALGLGEVSEESLAARRKPARGARGGYTREGMGALINQVLSDPSYAAAARRAGATARALAAVRPPLRLAVEEIELALRHRGYGAWRPHPKHASAAEAAGGGSGSDAAAGSDRSGQHVTAEL